MNLAGILFFNNVQFFHEDYIVHHLSFCFIRLNQIFRHLLMIVRNLTSLPLGLDLLLLMLLMIEVIVELLEVDPLIL